MADRINKERFTISRRLQGCKFPSPSFCSSFTRICLIRNLTFKWYGRSTDDAVRILLHRAGFSEGFPFILLLVERSRKERPWTCMYVAWRVLSPGTWCCAGSLSGLCMFPQVTVFFLFLTLMCLLTRLHRGAEAGVPNSMNRVAVCYSVGIGVPVDHNKYFEWEERAADAGWARSQYQVAVLYKYVRICPFSLSYVIFRGGKNADTIFHIHRCRDLNVDLHGCKILRRQPTGFRGQQNQGRLHPNMSWQRCILMEKACPRMTRSTCIG